MQDNRFYIKNPYKTASYQQQCLTKPILSSVVMGTLFAGFDVAQGAKFSPQSVGRYIGLLYVYNAAQCPMEAIHGRKSLWHNIIASGSLGYIGVSRGLTGIPFVNPYALSQYPYIRPSMIGFAVYGAMGGAFGSLGGKRL
jgi:hypothetical protein